MWWYIINDNVWKCIRKQEKKDRKSMKIYKIYWNEWKIVIELLMGMKTVEKDTIIEIMNYFFCQVFTSLLYRIHITSIDQSCITFSYEKKYE